ncbi:MAG: tRNA (guanosine(37)-N1)-methyltransferase TrmD [Firmicutes bacterium]|nr:tRNA (guanosine(37)-N1)-methyltransferase TrmD [Bacillota bacterium]
MKIKILTLFPEMYNILSESVIGKALKQGAFEVEIFNIRDFSKDKHKRCDDAPFGGGTGMVMTPQPLYDAITAVDPNHTALRIYLSPKGKVLNQEKVVKLSKLSEIVLINGSYEGVDERIINLCVDEEISIGDYILTSGDLASLVLTNAVARYIPKVLGSESSTEEESFSEGLLEYPHFTRPQEFMGLAVPEILLSGNHAKIKEWREGESIKITKERRPELIKNDKQK